MSWLEYQVLENTRLTEFYVIVGISGPGKLTFNGVICHSWNVRSLINVRLTEFINKKKCMLVTNTCYRTTLECLGDQDLSFIRVRVEMYIILI